MVYLGDWCYFGILHVMPRRPWEKGSMIYHVTLFGRFFSIKGRSWCKGKHA